MCTYKHTRKRAHTQSDSHATTANQSVLELGTKEEIPFDILYNKAVSHTLLYNTKTTIIPTLITNQCVHY